MDETAYYNRRIGTTLQGKWTLERLLGAGGMAAVYVGVHRIGRREAIKILHPEVAANAEVRGRFEQEAHAVNRLRHPGAVEIRDFDVTEDGCPFLVMELLEGETLSAKLERNAATVPELLQWTDEILEVLAAAHDLGIIHRDIKPDNLFIQTDGRLKVLDFGIARMREGAPRTAITRTGTALGTLSYMPPEQARGIHIDGRADVYSVGATLFRALGRRRIHDGASDADVLIKVATTPAPPLASVAPHVAAPLCSVVDCALAFDREHRYPNARTMQADIRALARNEAPPYVTEHPPPPHVDLAPLSSGPVSSGAPVSSSPGSDERTRAEGSAQRRSQPLAFDSTDPAPTRVEMKAATPVAVTALDAGRGTPPPVSAATAAYLPAPAQLSPSVPETPSPRSRTGVLVVVGVVVFGVVFAIAAVIVGLIWWRGSVDDSDSEPGTAVNPSTSEQAEVGEGNTVQPLTGRKTPVVGTAPGTADTTAPPATTVATPPGATVAPPSTKSVAPPVTTAPPATTTPPKTPPTATTPPAATTPPKASTTAPPGTKPPDTGKKKKRH